MVRCLLVAYKDDGSGVGAARARARARKSDAMIRFMVAFVGRIGSWCFLSKTMGDWKRRGIEVCSQSACDWNDRLTMNGRKERDGGIFEQ